MPSTSDNCQGLAMYYSSSNYEERRLWSIFPEIVTWVTRVPNPFLGLHASGSALRYSSGCLCATAAAPPLALAVRQRWFGRD